MLNPGKGLRSYGTTDTNIQLLRTQVHAILLFAGLTAFFAGQ